MLETNLPKTLIVCSAEATPDAVENLNKDLSTPITGDAGDVADPLTVIFSGVKSADCVEVIFNIALFDPASLLLYLTNTVSFAEGPFLVKLVAQPVVRLNEIWKFVPTVILMFPTRFDALTTTNCTALGVPTTWLKIGRADGFTDILG